MKKNLISIEQIGNAFELIGIILVLFLALVFEFGLNELPCPLCLLQRIGFLGVAFGFMLNLRFGCRPSHYSIVILSALFTGFVALRQICLHVIPGSGAYGSPIFGLHLYTWSFVIAMGILITTALLLSRDCQYTATVRHHKRWQIVVHILFALMTFIIIANMISIFLQCGLHICPDNPVGYAL